MRAVTTLALALVVVGAARAQSGDGDAFVAGLAAADRLMKRGQWEPAQKKLIELLREHENQGYARAHRAAVIDGLERCAFGAAHPDPELDELVSGDLQSVNLATGKLKIRYTDQLWDFESDGRFRMFPAAARGSYTLTFRGSSYPSLAGDDSGPTAVVAWADGDGFFVGFGLAQETSGGQSQWLPGRISRVKTKSIVDEKEMAPVRPGKAFTLKVQVKPTSISASYDGRVYLKARKPKDLDGYWGYDAIPYDELIVEGSFEPSWLQRKLDEWRAQRREEFRAGFRIEQIAPPWLLSDAPLAEAEAAAPKGDARYPGPFSPGYRRAIERLERHLEREEHREGLAFAASLTDDELSAAAKTWFAAVFRFALGDFDQALAQTRAVVAADPGWYPARDHEADCLQRARLTEEAIAARRKLAAEHPTRVEAHEALALLLLDDGRIDEARATIVQALTLGLRTRELELIDQWLTYAEKGPRWSKTHESKTRHYHVFSDIDKATCAEAAQVLEQAHRAYGAYLQVVGDDAGRRFPVYLFSGKQGFDAYADRVLGGASAHTAGLYSPLLKQLLIWNLPDRTDMMRTVRHEGFHQYLDRLIRRPPTWLNEGLAEYYERAGDGNVWRDGAVREDHLETLGERGLVPLRTFLHVGHARFYEIGLPSYAQAWAFVHFLRHSGPQREKLFRALFDLLQGPIGPDAAVDRIFGQVDLAALDQELARYVAELRESLKR